MAPENCPGIPTWGCSFGIAKASFFEGIENVDAPNLLKNPEQICGIIQHDPRLQPSASAGG